MGNFPENFQIFWISRREDFRHWVILKSYMIRYHVVIASLHTCVFTTTICFLLADRLIMESYCSFIIQMWKSLRSWLNSLNKFHKTIWQAFVWTAIWGTYMCHDCWLCKIGCVVNWCYTRFPGTKLFNFAVKYMNICSSRWFAALCIYMYDCASRTYCTYFFRWHLQLEYITQILTAMGVFAWIYYDHNGLRL